MKAIDEFELSPYAQTILKRYKLHDKEDWAGCSDRVSKFVANGDDGLAKKFFDIIHSRKFIPGGRYLRSAGREIQMVSNCMLLRAGDSREAWAKLEYDHIMCLSLGSGIGTYYSDVRPAGSPIKKTGGIASGPVSLMEMSNSVARKIQSGGTRRAALWAGLSWDHPDVEMFYKSKNWPTQIRALKEADPDFPATLDMTNISVCLDDKFFKEIKKNEEVQRLYYDIVRQMCKTGEPGFSINIGKHINDVLRNACNEVTSDTPHDSCNLGSVNLSRIKDLSELEDVTRLATRLLYLGTFRGTLPTEEFEEVRRSNRRLGLGIMGLHEWLLRNDLQYEPSSLLGKWLHTWEMVSDEEAKKAAIDMGDVEPIAVRAIAPTGTISLIGETTSGIEPIFCRAYRRRWLDAGGWKYSYIIDPTAARLVEEGMDPNDIEDAYTLSKDVERRLAIQAFIQGYCDQGISSTINVPAWGEPGNNNAKRFSEILLKYLPQLRGITVFPEDARPGQPLMPITMETALKHDGVIYDEEDRCVGGICSV